MEVTKMNFQLSRKSDIKKELLRSAAQLPLNYRSANAQLTLNRTKRPTSQNALQAP
jgi:hypothetical protein